MPHPAEVNQLEFGNDLPEHVLQAMRDEQERWRNDFRTFGPHVVGMDTLKPRVREAVRRAILEHEQKSQQNG